MKLMRLNVSKRGLGVSVGPRGASVSFGRRGAFLNVSPLPGSGIRVRKRLGKVGLRDGAARTTVGIVKHNRLGAEAQERDKMLLILFAWFFEIFGVIFGAANSLYVTLGDPEVRPWPITMIGYFPTLPLIVLAAGELLRIPFAKAYHMPRSWWFKTLALAAFIGLWGIGIENWTFGIERMVALRLKPAEAIHMQLREVDQQLTDLTGRKAKSAADLKIAQEQLAKDIADAEKALQRNTAAVKAENEGNTATLKKIHEMGMSTAANVKIIEPQSKVENARHTEALKVLTEEAKSISESLTEAKRRVEDMAKEDRKIGNGGLTVADLEAKRGTLTSQLAHEVRDNSIHRIAAAWFHVPAERLSEEQLAKAKNFFSLFGAIIISGIAGAAAFVYYAPTNKPWLRRAIRGYIARLRKGVVRTEIKEVEKEVIKEKLVAEKEVPVIIRETTVKIVPVRGLKDEQQPFSVAEKITGPEAEEKLRVVRGDK
jgi:hypothetical protein